MAIDPRDIRLSVEQRRRLAQLANSTGKDWTELFEEMIRAIASHSSLSPARELTAEAFEAELTSLSFQGPSLPDSFSRADIYIDHD